MKTLAACLLGACCASAMAQTAAPVPFYTPPAFMQGLHQHWYAPRSAAFAAAAAAMPPAIERVCAGAGGTALNDARSRWQSAALAWDALAAVAVGPLLQRRSMRQIDFTPTRPELIARAIRAEPADAKAMERVGTPAKGLPALEWLLWTQPVAAGTPGCRYAVRVAAEIVTEADALARAFGELAARDWPNEGEAASAATAEMLNQWVGGIERLRWANMDKPLKSAGNKSPAFPRAASGSTRQSWTAQWQGLQALGAASTGAAPDPGAGLVPLETYLRGRGLNPLADKLAAASAQVNRQMEALTASDLRQPEAVTRSLASLKRLAEAEIAPALEVNIGFSDADGD
jgi:predicted lipoprotein